MRTVFLALLLAAGTVGGALAENTTVATLLPPLATAAENASINAASLVAVPVLKEPIQKGETITADNIVMKDIPASQAYASTIQDAEELAGQQAIRPLIAGQPVNKLHVRVAPLVSRNQTVTFVFRRGGIELSGQGQALDDGQAGQTIRVVNAATRSTVRGTVTATGTVEMN